MCHPVEEMKAWLQAFRFNSLIVSSIGVMVGTAVAIRDGQFDLVRFLLAWLGSVAIQAGTNLTNVYYNYKSTSASADPRAFDPRNSTAVIRLGLLTPAQIHRGGLVFFGAGVACGLALTWLCGWTILLLGIPAIAAGYFYAGPPVQYGYYALGVFSVFLFMGPVMVCGAYYVMALSFSASPLAASIPIGLLAAGIMHTNDLRDYDTDVLHGKHTLATMLGRHGAGFALAMIDGLAFVVTLAAVIAGLLPWLALLVLIAIPHTIDQLRTAFSATNTKQLHAVWLLGVKLHLEFGLLLIAGLLASAALHFLGVAWA
jgi:1,4-dihydroxy-2-naphthoate octaprenyltransferase